MITKVIFIGLSNKIDKLPLSSDTISGRLIDRMVVDIKADCIKSNLVNFAPLDDYGKLRYPNNKEKDIGFRSLSIGLKENYPYIAVCLGDKVFNYLKDRINNDNIIKIKHPSYIAVYKRQEVEMYIKNSVNEINSKILR